MNVTFSEEELAFREQVRAIFRDDYPEDLRRKCDLAVPLEREDFVRFQKWLFKHGWAGINWPVEYGGTGWTPVQQYIFAI